MNESGPELYVIGAGGHAREVHAYIQDLIRAGWKGTLKGFVDDRLAPGRHGYLDVLGPLNGDTFSVAGRGHFITALGDNPVRREIVKRVSQISGKTPAAWTLIHPKAWIGENVQIGEGTCVAPAAIITANSWIGRHSILNIKASVSHDCSVGDFVNINPGATICGWVNVGDGANVGAGATVKDRVSIGAWSVIGAGAVVVRDVPPNVTVAGVPARIIRDKGLL